MGRVLFWAVRMVVVIVLADELAETADTEAADTAPKTKAPKTTQAPNTAAIVAADKAAPAPANLDGSQEKTAPQRPHHTNKIQRGCSDETRLIPRDAAAYFTLNGRFSATFHPKQVISGVLDSHWRQFDVKIAAVTRS